MNTARERRSWGRVLALGGLLAAIVLLGGCRPPVTQAAAQQIAATELQWFCAKEQVSPALCGTAKVAPQPDGSYELDYDTPRLPRRVPRAGIC